MKGGRVTRDEGDNRIGRSGSDGPQNFEEFMALHGLSSLYLFRTGEGWAAEGQQSETGDVIVGRGKSPAGASMSLVKKMRSLGVTP